VYSNQLNKNTGVVDALVFSNQVTDSYFWYIGYTTAKNLFLVRRDIMPQQTSIPWGSNTEFILSNIADKAGPMQLIFDLAPLAQAGGTYVRFVDGIGICAWEKIVFTYGQTEIYTLYPEDAYMKYVQLNDIEHKDAQGVLIAIDKSTVQRNTLAASSQTIIFDMPFPHTRHTDRYLEIMQLSHEPRFTVYWKQFAQVVQSDAPTPTTNVTGGGITNARLRCTYIHLDGDERDANTRRLDAGDGIVRLFDDFRCQTDLVPANTVGEYKIQLRNFNTSTKKLAFWLRPQPSLNTNYANEYFGNGVFQPIVYWRLESADGRIIENIEHLYNLYYLHPLYHHSPAGTIMYEHSFAVDPDDMLNSSTSFNLGTNTALTLIINFGAGSGANVLQCCTMVDQYNTVQHVRGDLQKNFN